MWTPATYRDRRTNQTQCRVCGCIFEASRHDAKYCSAKCRKRISRAMARLKETDPVAADPKASERASHNLTRTNKIL